MATDWTSHSNHPPYLLSLCCTVMQFLQVFSQFKDTYKVLWPDIVNGLMQVFSIFNLNLVAASGVDCAIDVNYYAKFASTLGIPAAMTTLIFGTYFYKKYFIVRDLK